MKIPQTNFSNGAAARPATVQGALAFTLVELLVVLGAVAFLLLAVLPSQARAKPGGQALQCLSNMKLLTMANSMYQADNRDDFAMVFRGGFVPSASSTSRPWVTGWLDWTTSSDNTNLAYLLEPRYASLASYFGWVTNVYKCPADTYISPAQRARGWDQRVRSVSANAYVGKGNGWAIGPDYQPGGPNNLGIYAGAASLSDLRIPGPARTWVYIEEHPDSMNDGAMFAPDTATNFPDLPATYHNGAAAIAMADGRSELHRWRGPAVNRSRNGRDGGVGVVFSFANMCGTTNGDPDLYWLSYATPRNTTRTVAD